VRGEVQDNKPLTHCWPRFRNIRKVSVPLFVECLALIGGALVRATEFEKGPGPQLDKGLCRIADALLDDLSSRAVVLWERFTILGETEFFGEMAQIIRLRFPEVSIWNIPIAAHEFGHFIGPELKQAEIGGTFRYPFQDELRKVEDEQGRAFLQEYFADLFATYTLGPAFACTCILLRFDPIEAYQDKKEHPAYAKRFYLIRRTLEKMNLGPYQGIVAHLDIIWRQSLKALGLREHLAQEIASQLDELLEMLYDLVITELPTIQYKDLSRAYRLSRKLLIDAETANIVEAARIAAPEHTLVDILNAAWICRVEIEDQDDKLLLQIGERAVKLCEEIIDRKR